MEGRNALEAVPSLRLGNAFLNAVPGQGLVRQQMIGISRTKKQRKIRLIEKSIVPCN